MTADSGGVTLKLDADTASYVAKITEAAAAGKKLHESHKEAGESLEKVADFAKEALGAMTSFALPLTVAGVGLKAIESTAEAWKEHITSAREELEKIHSLNEALVRTQAPPGAAEAIKANQGSLLSTQDLIGIVSQIGAPGTPASSAEQYGSIVKSAARVAAAQGDPIDFAGIEARLMGAGVKNAEADAFYVTRHISQDEQESAIGAVVNNPEHADELLRIFSNPGLRGNREMKRVLHQAYGAWNTDGRPGTFSQYLKTGRAVHAVGRAGMGYLKNLIGAQGPEIRENELDETIEKAEHNTNVTPVDLHKIRENETAKIAANNYGQDADWFQRVQDNWKQATMDEPMGGFGLVMKGGFGQIESEAKLAWVHTGSKEPFATFLARYEAERHARALRGDHSMEWIKPAFSGPGNPTGATLPHLRPEAEDSGEEHRMFPWRFPHAAVATAITGKATPHDYQGDARQLQRWMDGLISSVKRGYLRTQSQGEQAP